MSQFSNSTLPGISNTAERYTWATWLMTVFLASLIGDTTILIASIKYQAFKLHPVIVTFIQHIAVCDLIMSLVVVMTQSVSLIAGKWAFGTVVCYVRPYLSFYCTVLSLLLVSAMTVIKLIIVKNPQKSKCWSGKQAHTLCAVLWTLSLYAPATFLLIDNGDVHYDNRMYTCFYTFTSTKWDLLRPISLIIFSLIPTLITIITSALLIKHLLFARKVARLSHSHAPWQGIVTVVLTAAVYCLSFLPITAYLVVKPFVKDGLSRVYISRVTDTLKYLNVVANIFIYTLTVASFRAFLRTRMEMAAVFISGFFSKNGEESNLFHGPYWTLYFLNETICSNIVLVTCS